MKKIKTFISVSLDGYISPLSGGFFYLLNDFSFTEDENWGRMEFHDSIDTIIMGGNTYQELSEMNLGSKLYEGKEVYVISANTLRLNNGVHFIAENFIEKILELKEQAGKDIHAIGGGILITSLLERNLIDSMIINYVPVMLGDGIPLFPKFQDKSKWKFVNSFVFKNGILRTEYELIK